MEHLGSYALGRLECFLRCFLRDSVGKQQRECLCWNSIRDRRSTAIRDVCEHTRSRKMEPLVCVVLQHLRSRTVCDAALHLRCSKRVPHAAHHELRCYCCLGDRLDVDMSDSGLSVPTHATSAVMWVALCISVVMLLLSILLPCRFSGNVEAAGYSGESTSGEEKPTTFEVL